MADRNLTDLITGGAVAQQPNVPVGVAAVRPVNDGLDQDYMESSQSRTDSDAATTAEEWAKSEGFAPGGQMVTKQTYENPDVAVAATEQELPNPFPTDREAPAEQGAFAATLRNVAEIPRAIVAGANSAVVKLTDPLVGPLVNWLDTHVANGRIPLQELKTPTGHITKALAEFITPYIPIFQGLKVLGAGTKLAAAGAGMIVDAALAEKGSGNLANLWNEMGGDPNILSEALAARPEDEDSLMRVKAAATGLLGGVALDGFLHALRFTRSLLHDKFIKGALDSDVERNFGDATQEEIFNAVGDTKAPMLLESLEREHGLGAAERMAELTGNQPSTVGAAIKAKTIEERAAEEVQAEITSPLAKIYKAKDGRDIHVVPSNSTPTLSSEVRTGESLDFTNPAEPGGLVYNKTFVNRAYLDGQMVGEARVEVVGDGIAHVMAIKVKDEFQRLRVGTALEQDLKDRGFKVIKSPNQTEEGRLFRTTVDEGVADPPKAKAFLTELEQKPDLPPPVPEVAELTEAEAKAVAGGSVLDLETKIKSLDDEISQAEAKPDLVNGKPSPAHRKLLAELRGQRKATNTLLAEAKLRKTLGAVTKREQAETALAAGPTAEEIKQSYATVKLDEGEVYINMNRLGTADDVKAAMRLIAEKSKGRIDEARRGTITNAETKKMADALGMSVEDLLARRQGQAFNAEEITAARRLWVASGERMVALAEKAASPNAGALDQFAFRKAMATHSAIGSEVLGASAEAGRALQAHRIVAKGAIEQARAINQYLNSLGGKATTEEIAQRLLILKKRGDPAALRKYAEKGWGAKSFDVVREIWVNGLLSAPSTHLVNSVSNAMATVMAVTERAVAARIGQVTGTTSGVELGEATTMMYALAKSAKDAFQYAWLALKTGETGKGMGKIDLPVEGAVSSTALGLKQNSALARGVDFLGDWLVRLPGKFLASQDEFFKTINYRMELSAQSLRQAMSEGKTGKELAERVRQLEIDPPENLRLAATDASLMNIFANDTGSIGKTLLRARHDHPALAFIMPFVKTPVNIARYTFERSPFAPMVGQWRADIAAGGARADLAIARMSIGTMIMANAFGLADSGKISGKGPRDPGERDAYMRQGWQEYSIQLGGKWHSYNRLDPYGALMGFSADVAEAVRHGEFDEDDVDEWGEVVAMGISAVSNVAISKTYLKGISDTFHAVTGKRYEIEGYLNNFASSFIPYTSLAGTIERASDPILRETNSPWEAVQAKLKGLSDQLPPKMDLWGRPRSSASSIGMDYDVSPEAQKRITQTYDALSPIKTTRIEPEPIDTEIMRLAPLAGKDNVGGSPPQRISKKTTFDGVQVSFKKWRDVYVDYVKLAGNELKDPAFGLGCKDYLNAIVTGKHPLSVMYDKVMSDETKIKFINSTVERYRKMAQRQIMEDPKHLEFADHVRAIQEAKRAALMPQGTQ